MLRLKGKNFISLIIVLLIISGFIMSCDGDNDGGGGGGVAMDASALIAEAKKGAPVFTNSASRSTYGTLTDYGTTADSARFGGIYSTFKDYDPDGGTSEDQGVDDSNLWFGLDNTLNKAEELLGYDGSAFDSAVAVAPSINMYADRSGPYTAGNETVESVDKGIWAAANVEGNSTEVLVSYIDHTGSNKASGVKYIDYNSSTGDVIMDICYIAEYSTGEKYSPRLFVDGNTT